MSTLIDLTGQRFGSLVVLERDGNIGNQPGWRCVCDCGSTIRVRGSSLRGGVTASCGCSRIIDETGNRFGRLLVIQRAPSRGHVAWWVCRCDCGGTVTTRGVALRRGDTRSCGCLNRTHGYYRTPTHTSWQAMLNRCRNPRAHKYPDYGGRGIEVCERWSLFANFLADMGERPPGTSIDRINVDGHYEPGNCRWATPSEQSRNQRRHKSKAA